MFTLWILILGFKNVAGDTLLNSTGAQPAMQPIATYSTQKECSTVAQMLYKTLQEGGVSEDVICLPTGVSDPVAKHYAK
jgi:hypothetical protein